MSTVDWESYERYARCPLMHRYENVDADPPEMVFKDTQHLVRSHAQSQVSRQWFIEERWHSSNPMDLNLWVEGAARKAVDDCWLDSSEGRPLVTRQDLVGEISFNLRQSLPVLKNHIMTIIEPNKEPDYILVDVEGTVPWVGDEDICLQSQVDFVVGKNGCEVLYVSRGTKAPKYLKPEQMRWIVGTHWPENGEWETVPFWSHFYVIHHDASIRPVECLVQPEGNFNEDYRKWLTERNTFLGRMRESDYTATPSSRTCKICSFSNSCPSKHVPRSRRSTEGDEAGAGPALDVPERGKRGIHIL